MKRICIGDCLDVLPRIAAGSVDMVFADLPYGVTSNKWDSRIDLAKLWPLLLAVSKPNAAFVFTATQPFATTLINSQPKLFRYDLIWDKMRGSSFYNANRMPISQHEAICVFYRQLPQYNPQRRPGKPYKQIQGGVGSNWGTKGIANTPVVTICDGGRYPISIIQAARDVLKTHPTQKPVALLEWLIKTYSNEGDTILDPVMGSGTTCVAAMNTGRNFVGIEKEAPYFITAAKRICPSPTS